MTSIFNKIQWIEGMPLMPQHFQQQDRYHEHALKAQIHLLNRFYWGFYELSLDQNALEEGTLILKKAQGYFPDGTFFDVPELSSAPEPLQLENGLDNTSVYLVTEKVLDSSYQTKRDDRYLFSSLKVNNTETDILELTELHVKRLHLKFIQTPQLSVNHSALGVIKTKDIRVGKVQFDEEYIPALININASQRLTARTKMLLEKIREWVDKMPLIPRLAEYNCYIQFQHSTILKEAFYQINHLLNTGPTHPESLYLTLLKLSAELSSIHQIRPPTPPFNYQHDDFGSSFNPLIDFIEIMLKLNPSGGAIQIPLKENQYGFWLSQSIDKKLLSKMLILTIKTEQNKSLIAEQVPKHLKMGTQKHIYTLVKQALPGITLLHLKTPPSAIFLNEQQFAFGLEKNSKSYAELTEELNIALHGTHALGKFTPQLWAID